MPANGETAILITIIFAKSGVKRDIFMKILDYRPNFGTFSAGFEVFKDVEVSEVVELDKNGFYGYNRIHKQWFPTSNSPISTFKPSEPIDLALFRPDFGENVGRKGKNNFYFYDFEACLKFLQQNCPKFAIFQTEIDIIPLVNNAKSYVRDGFNQVSKDRLIYALQQIGYKAHLVVLDEADYGIPLHRSFAFYVATPKDFDLHIPKPLFTRTGKGSYSKYRTVEDAIGDLDKMGDWVPYAKGPQNTYQKLLRDENAGKVTWHHPPKIKKATKEKIASIKQGSNNDTKFPKSRGKGYNRAKWQSICRCMDASFYLPSSRGGDSIHPIADRPFTIREGCRIHGLPDQLSFDLKTSRKTVAKMIHESVAPSIGTIFGLSLKFEL